MHNRYKSLFWATIIILILSNVYWLYQTVDNAVGHSYYQVNCEEWKDDLKELKKVLPIELNKNDMVNFLAHKDIAYNGFAKGEEFVIQLHSFDFVYNQNGQLIQLNER